MSWLLSLSMVLMGSRTSTRLPRRRCACLAIKASSSPFSTSIAGTRVEYLSRWQETSDAAEAYHNRLRPGWTLAPVGRSARHTEVDQPARLPGYRLPNILRHMPARSRYLQLDRIPVEEMVFTLQRKIRTGPASWSQVCGATLKTPHYTSDLPLVIKLFQESRFPSPRNLKFEHYRYWSAAAQSANEAWAFERLRDLQGTVLPHSYGFFDFPLPCGEIVSGHVLEYIEGKPLCRDLKGMQDGTWYNPYRNARREIWVERLFHTMRIFHLYGVHHGDIAPRNIIRLGNNPDFFVFLDFGRSSPHGTRNPLAHDDIPALRGALFEIHDCRAVVAFLEKMNALGHSVFTPSQEKALNRLRTDAEHLEESWVAYANESRGDGLEHICRDQITNVTTDEPALYEYIGSCCSPNHPSIRIK